MAIVSTDPDKLLLKHVQIDFRIKVFFIES